MAVLKKSSLPLPTPVYKRLIRFIIALLKYPRRVAKRYAGYNGAIGEILHETGDESLDKIRRRNSQLVNIFIYLPMFLGFMVLLIILYLNHEAFGMYINKITAPVYAKGLFTSIGAYWRKLTYIFTGLPISSTQLYCVLGGYLGSVVGAWILSLNPAFKEQERIIHIFATLGYIDSEGKPWKVTWTPNAIMIESFNNDPFVLSQNTRFWSTVNFPPTTPKVFRNNMNKFIVQRKYELPDRLEYDLKGDQDV